MPFPAIENLAVLDAAAEERKRRERLAAIDRDAARLADDMAEQKAEALNGPAGLLAELAGGGRRVAIAGDVQRAADEDRFLNAQADRRLDRRATTLEGRKRELSVPAPTVAERTATLTAPLGRFATEDPTVAAAELATNREGRLADLQKVREGLTRDVSRETPPRPIYVGRGAADEPYFTNLSREELHAERRTAGAIRERAGMPEQGRGPRDLERIRVGGTSLGPAKSPGTTPQDALLQDLDAMIGQAERAKLSPREQAGDLAVQQPAWDALAAETSPGEIGERLLAETASGAMRPETAAMLQRRYDRFGRAAIDRTTGEFDPDLYREFLRQGRTPATGEAEQALRAGGEAVPAAEAEKEAAVADATTPPPGGPGSTPSPALAAESASDPKAGLLASIFGAAQRGTDRFGGAPMAETPEGLPAAAARYGLPAAAALATGGASLPAQAAIGFGATAGGELLGQLLGGEDLDTERAGMAGVGGGLAGPAAGLLGRGLARGGRALGALGKRALSDIPAVHGPGTGGAPTRVLGGLTEEAGVRGAEKSALDLVRLGSADAASTPIPTGPVPYLPERLPALRGGGGFTTSGARIPDEVLSVEDLIEQYLRATRRGLPAPPLPPEVLPALRGGGFTLR